MRALFIANTPYQVFISIRIKLGYHRDTPADIIITDHMNNGEKLCERLRHGAVFDNVYFVRDAVVEARKGMKRPFGKLSDLLRDMNPKKELDKIIVLSYTYNTLYAGSYGGFPILVLSALQQASKRYVNFCIYEDGITTYTDFYGDWYASRNRKKSIRERVYLAFSKKLYLQERLDGLFVAQRELLDWLPECTVTELPPFELGDTALLNAVNNAFNYASLNDRYDKKVIFLEESFYADGVLLGEEELLLRLANIVGKENVFVKRHPRCKTDRFEKLGFSVNNDTEIPWELIVANNDFGEKIVVTIGSSAIAFIERTYGDRACILSLFNCIAIKPDELPGDRGRVYKFVRKYFESCHGVYMPHDIADAEKWLGKRFK